MKYHLSKETGGLVNVWLNVAKLLIALIFAYQLILSGQLKTDLLSLSFSVLTMDSSANGNQDNTKPNIKTQINTQTKSQDSTTSIPFSQVIHAPDYRFFIPIVPLSHKEYNNGEIKIIKATKEDGKEFDLRKDQQGLTAGFPWPGRNSGTGSIVVRDFSLKNILNNIEDLGSRTSPSSLKVFFQVVIYHDPASKESLAEWPPKTEPGFRNWVQLLYEPLQTKEPYGPLPIVQGQYCDFPYQLKGKDLTPNGSILRNGVPTTDSNITIENNYTVGGQKVGRFKAEHLDYNRGRYDDNIYNLTVSYKDDKGMLQERVVIFIVQENRKPRTINSAAGNQVLLYYPDDRYTSPYSHFSLDKFIVDPDGLDEGVPLQGGLRPKNIRILEQTSHNNNNYQVVGTKRDFWHLRIIDESEIQDGDEIKLQITDDYNGNSVTIVLSIIVQ